MNRPENSIFIIFGGTGDLTRRKIVPALFRNFQQGLMPEKFAIVGLGRTLFDDIQYRQSFHQWLEDENISAQTIADFLSCIYYRQLDVGKEENFRKLHKFLHRLNHDLTTGGNCLFYLAVGPDFFEPIVTNLGKIGLVGKNSPEGWKRLIVEKPFGRDLESAKSLNRTLLQYFDEKEIFRIDHYLGKETVQNILAFRFANGIYEPLWNRNYIDHIEITGSESDGVGTRGGYYDHSGALRDMIQNHLLQLLAIVTMEPPNSFEAKAVRDEKVKVFEALSPIDITNIEKSVIRGQYTAAEMKGKPVPGYREEAKVAQDSMTETYVAMKAFIDNWRWSGVPFYIRTGKRLPARVNEIVIHFKKTPHHLFQNMGAENVGHNKLILRIQPDEGIVLSFGMKKPGEGFRIETVSMDFHYSDLTTHPLPDSYERLLLDVLNGDPTLYARNDAVEACWKYITPVLTAWQENPHLKLYPYKAGSWGPEEANLLFENQKPDWHNPCPNLTTRGKNCGL